MEEEEKVPYRVHCDHMDGDGIDGPCDFCGRKDEACATIQIDVWSGGSGWRPGPIKKACYNCWHMEREKTRGYRVCRVDGWECGIVGTLDEASDFLREMYLREGSAPDGFRNSRYMLVESPWIGGRRSHPGYMGRRRAAVIASHPEYGDRHGA